MSFLAELESQVKQPLNINKRLESQQKCCKDKVCLKHHSPWKGEETAEGTVGFHATQSQVAPPKLQAPLGVSAMNIR